MFSLGFEQLDAKSRVDILLPIVKEAFLALLGVIPMCISVIQI